ncbi:hypothetical protein K502DRAFT_367222 [Neoconidiobolus thromboides FSU 785]|nr:hypothetical protein K502DRAFT_367222 [Neoconidiobolus thromboides FSU 785]
MTFHACNSCLQKMKFQSTLLITIASLSTAIAAAPEANIAAEIQACGAAGSCKGIGGRKLCNDRCKKCSGPTGPYKKGDCCGWGWLTCCCYYE